MWPARTSIKIFFHRSPIRTTFPPPPIFLSSLGKRNGAERSFWLAGDHQFTSARFSGQPLSLYDAKMQWDDTAIAENPQNRQEWDASAGATIIPGLMTSLAYGQSRADSLLLTDKVSPAVQYSLNDLFSGELHRFLFPSFVRAGQGIRKAGECRRNAHLPASNFRTYLARSVPMGLTRQRQRFSGRGDRLRAYAVESHGKGYGPFKD